MQTIGRNVAVARSENGHWIVRNVEIEEQQFDRQNTERTRNKEQSDLLQLQKVLWRRIERTM